MTAPARWWPGVLLAGISCAALLWRRTRPGLATAFVLLCATGMALTGYAMTVLLLAPLMMALYSQAARTERTTARNFTLAAVILVVGAALIADPAGDSVALNVIGPIAWLLLPAALGSTARFRRAYLDSVQARSEYAERTRDILTTERGLPESLSSMESARCRKTRPSGAEHHHGRPGRRHRLGSART